MDIASRIKSQRIIPIGKRPDAKELRRMFPPGFRSFKWTVGPRYRRVRSDSPAEKDDKDVSVRREQYNLSGFQTDFENAKFYIIKASSEEEIHKSLKYNFWACNTDGIKKLDAVFRENDPKCPIFLFFSVNASGQFVGVAEMVGQADFDTTTDFWFWKGCFPVRWHIVKDVPYSQLKHITLENNNNIPVVRSDNTQEVGLTQGVEMLKIFKNFAEEKSILDDFGYYEFRQRTLDLKRPRHLLKAVDYMKSEREYEKFRKRELGSATLGNSTKKPKNEVK